MPPWGGVKRRASSGTEELFEFVRGQTEVFVKPAGVARRKRHSRHGAVPNRWRCGKNAGRHQAGESGRDFVQQPPGVDGLLHDVQLVVSACQVAKEVRCQFAQCGYAVESRGRASFLTQVIDGRCRRTEHVGTAGENGGCGRACSADPCAESEVKRGGE